MPLSLILITREPDTARFAVDCGVDRVMVDLEILGKKERQQNRDTLISAHSVDDVYAVAQRIGGERLIVRTNDLHDGLGSELDGVLQAKPAAVMLPMVRSAEQVREYASLVDGRSEIITLVETAEGLEDILSIAAVPEVSELYIGLNDLHLDLGLSFMFEPIASGMIDTAMNSVALTGKPCGFGGVARMDEGLVSGELVLAEHVRLCSSAVILSRTFHRRSSDRGDLAFDEEFGSEVAKLRSTESDLRMLSQDVLLDHHAMFVETVNGIVRKC